MTFDLTYKRFGERSILIEWPSTIDEQILQDIIQFKDGIENNKIEYGVELKSAYNSLLITYNNLKFDFENEKSILKDIYCQKENDAKPIFRQWKIPVCYDPLFAIDLEAISNIKAMSKEAIIKRHSQTIYTVYFIGFLPGFLYLGGLDETLHVPRKSTPRLKIEKGAVAIGGKQTGVYPNESPGGWNVVGNSPIDFFDVTKGIPCFAKAGDTIIFNPISLKAYKNIKALVEAGVYQLESEVIDD